MDAFDAPAPLASSGRQAALLLTLLVALAATALAFERLGYAGLYSGSGLAAPAVVRELALSVPSLLYLAALWRLRGVARQVAAGDPFAPAASYGLRGAGAYLLAGAIAALLMPLAMRAAGVALPRQIDADIATLVIAAVGLAQLLVGRLIDQAAAAERELASFF